AQADRDHARSHPRARERAALRDDRAAPDRSARGDGGRGSQDRYVPDGRDHRAPRRAGRGARGKGLRDRGRGSDARLAATRRAPEDGRLHTTVTHPGAATGRLSTSNPNLQAIPIRTELGREIRSAFVAEEGCRLLSADYSQVELRILAHVSGEPKLRQAFAVGDDIHRATAAEVLGKDPATLTTGERAIAKIINFGIGYGI